MVWNVTHHLACLKLLLSTSCEGIEASKQFKTRIYKFSCNLYLFHFLWLLEILFILWFSSFFELLGIRMFILVRFYHFINIIMLWNKCYQNLFKYICNWSFYIDSISISLTICGTFMHDRISIRRQLSLQNYYMNDIKWIKADADFENFVTILPH